MPRPANGYEWSSWARRQPVQPASAKALLLALASYANARGECWPAEATLADDLCVSTRQVRNLVGVLEARGLITVEHERRASNGRRIVNVYRLAGERDGHSTKRADHRKRASRGATGNAVRHHRKPSAAATGSPVPRNKPMEQPTAKKTKKSFVKDVGTPPARAQRVGAKRSTERKRPANGRHRKSISAGDLARAKRRHAPTQTDLDRLAYQFGAEGARDFMERHHLSRDELRLMLRDIEKWNEEQRAKRAEKRRSDNRRDSHQAS